LNNRAQQQGFKNFHHRFYTNTKFRQQQIAGGYEPALIDIMFKEILETPISIINQPPKGTAYKSRTTPSLRALPGNRKLHYQTVTNFALFMTDVEPVNLTREEAPWMPIHANTFAVIQPDEEDIETHVTSPILDLSYPRAMIATNHSEWISQQIDAMHADLHDEVDNIVLSDDENAFALMQPVGSDTVRWKPRIRMPINIYAAAERKAAQESKRSHTANESYLARYGRLDLQHSATTKARRSQATSSTDEPPRKSAYKAYPSSDPSGQASRQQAAEHAKRTRQIMQKHPSITQAEQMSNLYCTWCGRTDHDTNDCSFYCTECATYGHLTYKCPMWHTTKNKRAFCNVCNNYGHEEHTRHCKLYQLLKTKYCKNCNVYGHWPQYTCQQQRNQ
jgi:hypothetical protein